MNRDYRIAYRAIIKSYAKRLVLESTALTLASECLRLEHRRQHADRPAPSSVIDLDKIRHDQAV